MCNFSVNDVVDYTKNYTQEELKEKFQASLSGLKNTIKVIEEAAAKDGFHVSCVKAIARYQDELMLLGTAIEWDTINPYAEAAQAIKDRYNKKRSERLGN